MWSILCVIASIFFWQAQASGEYCQAGQEGQPYELSYKSPNDLDLSGSALMWSVRYTNGTLVDIPPCDVNENSSCDFPWHYKPVKEVDDYNLTSFEIEKVNSDHRDMEIILESSDHYFGKRSLIFSCRLPTYTRPIAPVCSAEKKRRNVIKVECTAKHVYPGIQCKIFQIKGDKMTSVISSKFHYHPNVYVNDTDYNEVTCSTAVLVPNPGSYRYYVEMMPHLPGLDSSNIEPVRSNESNPIFIVAVKILGPEQPIDLCPGQVMSIMVNCEAYGSTLRPTFEWKLNNQSVQLSHVEETFSSNGSVFSQSLDIKSEQDLYNIQCTVYLEADEQKKKMGVSDTMQVTFRKLSYVVTTLSYEGGLIENGTHIDIQRNGSLLCELDKTTENVSGIEIICNRDGQLVIQSKSNSDRVRAFMASKDPGTIDCECKAQLPDAEICRQRKHHVRITLLDGQPPQSTSNTHFILLVVLVVVAVLIIAVPFFCYAFHNYKRRKCSQLTSENKTAYELALLRDGDDRVF